jgi:hypothetical protein
MPYLPALLVRVAEWGSTEASLSQNLETLFEQDVERFGPTTAKCKASMRAICTLARTYSVLVIALFALIKG